jgi:hypothetical protein
MLLQRHSDLLSLAKRPPTGREQPHPMRAPVEFMRLSGDELTFLHPAERRGDRIRVARHQVGDRPLRKPLRVAFAQPAQDAELIRRDLQMCDALAKGLIEPVPGAPQKWRQAFRFSGRLCGGRRWKAVAH